MFQVIAVVLLSVVLAGFAFIAFAIAVSAKARLRDGKHDIYEDQVPRSADTDRTIDHLKYVSNAPRFGESRPHDMGHNMGHVWPGRS